MFAEPVGFVQTAVIRAEVIETCGIFNYLGFRNVFIRDDVLR